MIIVNIWPFGAIRVLWYVIVMMTRRFDSYGIHSKKGSEVAAQLNTQNHERKNHIGDYHHGNEGRQS